MQRVANIIISVGALGLLTLGGYLAFLDKTASATIALGVAFLLVVLLLLAKFKRFKGFGFEAEMWEEKQAEAAALVDRLRQISEAVGEQMALIASKLGLWGGSLSNIELADLADQLSRLSQAAGTSAARLTEILDPVYSRIELNYWSAAHRLVGEALKNELETVTALDRTTQADERPELVQRIQNYGVAKKQYDQFIVRGFSENKNLEPLITFAKSCPTLAPVDSLHAELNELNLDFMHFHASHTLRRRIDVAATPPRFTLTAP